MACCTSGGDASSPGPNEQIAIERALKDQQIRVLEGCFNDSGTLDMERVTTNLWCHRSDPDCVQAIIDLLTKHTDEKSVFDGVEFYLPQLAHMVIHLGEEFPLKTMQIFVLSVVQHSMHFALQLHWILIAMMQDYMPEMEDGQPNPGYEFLFYTRAVALLQTVDRCVMSGSPRRPFLEQLYRSGQVTETELRELEIADRRFNALAMIESLDETTWLDVEEGDLKGNLLFKRWKRKGKLKTHPWKLCYFKVQDRMLFCFRSKESGFLKRAIPLEDAEVITDPNAKHQWYFEVKSYYGKLKLRADSQQQFDNWVNKLKEIRDQPPHSFFEEGTVERQVTKVQEHKWLFFRNERKMVQQMTDIVEELRFIADVPARKPLFEKRLMDMQLPEYGYVPMCRSTDLWCNIIRITPNENKCFKSKARVPGMVTFEVEQSKEDVATHLFQLFTIEMHNDDDPFATRSSRDISVDFSMERGSEVDNSTGHGGGLLAGTVRRLFRGHNDVDSSPSKSEEESQEEPPRDSVNGSSGTESGKRTVWRPGSKLTRSGSKLTANYFRWPNMTLLENIAKKTETNQGLNAIPEERRAESTTPVSPASTAKTFGEPWSERVERLRTSSPFGNRRGWQINQIIAKSNDDVRQEVFIMQLFQFYKDTFENEGLSLWLQPYRILSTSNSTGLIEFVTDTSSFDALKKMDSYPGSLLGHFENTYGSQNSQAFKDAQKNYIESLAAYSIVCYLLAIKDRHNGNIMLDLEGHVIHIDYGFVFGSAPGNQFSMERAPFKLTTEMVEVMGGLNSEGYNRFVELCTDAMKAARNHKAVVETMIQIMMFKSKLPFAEHGDSVITRFQSRLLPNVHDSRLKAAVEQQLIRKSYNHTGANLYDHFQVATNGIAK
mmetsp:Transcript_31031/g.40995  ORF Transcript_31031/g.40995 Transcript_31031/m.40995 type:complete len:886 (+) Transcript_31031:185-2842(+)|eukprot:CAMPEP_0117740900 /NCGR_PEP_ID=MMETSP0947-20121206/4605_1 /TAXON_ID=44440 /ORGANISM="Chattonella subsalsa, Strain CCMP2191" /LENGTH=885 /DNA_ID=CAMNT_0005557079 /DNA_START=96 /DNA_END=2753 /DNA_ORIENTATION=-